MRENVIKSLVVASGVLAMTACGPKPSYCDEVYVELITAGLFPENGGEPQSFQNGTLNLYKIADPTMFTYRENGVFIPRGTGVIFGIPEDDPNGMAAYTGVFDNTLDPPRNDTAFFYENGADGLYVPVNGNLKDKIRNRYNLTHAAAIECRDPNSYIPGTEPGAG